MNLEKIWKEANRNRKVFQKRHEVWLNSFFTQSITSFATTSSENAGSSRGRPRKSFEEASIKTKKRRVEELLTKPTAELRFAVERSEPTCSKKTISPGLSAKQALALYLDLNLSVKKYNILRSVVNVIHKDCFPSYHALVQTKQLYLPTNINVTEISAEINLQEVLEKTASSILNILTTDQLNSRLKLICKWGFDGSSGHSLYKQKFNQDINSTDEFMF